MLLSRLTNTSLVVVSLLVGMTACTRTGEGTRGRTEDKPAGVTTGIAHVRYVNALPANKSADLYFGEAKLFGADRRTATDYVQIPAERRDFVLRQPGQADLEPLAKNSEGLREDAHYSVIAFDDKDGKATLRVVSDEESAPADGKAKVRIIDAVANIDDFGLYVAGRRDKLAGEPLLGAISGWQQVDAAQGSLELHTSDGANKVVPIPGAQLETGKLYTFVVADAPTVEKQVQVTVLENAPTKLAPAVPPTTVPPTGF